MRDVLGQVGAARAVLFDVDGTLYRQGPVRRAMMTQLVRAYLSKPSAGVSVEQNSSTSAWLPLPMVPSAAVSIVQTK